jgi:uncharacterized LabA/DUF88 family protein
MKNKTALLIDGGFFLKRYSVVYGKDPLIEGGEVVAKKLHSIVKDFEKKFDFDLYRIFYYDAYPFQEKAHNPITKQGIDFSKTELAKFRISLFDSLKKSRKVALRLGEIKKGTGWIIKPDQTKELLKHNLEIKDLTEKDVLYELRQKGVDLKIGLDIATLAYKKLVSQIILISGDSDFVPAIKVARREGIDFILDPMHQRVDDSLFEHIDGLHSVCPNPNKK